MKANGVETYGKPLGIAVKGGLFKKGQPTDEGHQEGAGLGG